MRRFGRVLPLAVVLSGCSTDNVLSLRPEVDVGIRTASFVQPAIRDVAPVTQPPPVIAQPTIAPVVQPDAALQPAPVIQPAPAIQSAPASEAADIYLAAYPRLDNPLQPVQPSPAVMPADEVACRGELKRLDVTYTELDPIHQGSCGIDHPVKVSAIGGIRIKPAATLRCEMAATFANWTRKELAPAARLRYFSGIKTIHQGSSYSCRNIAGEGVLSEHGKGNALDIMRVELNNGRDIDVRKPGLFAFRQRGFLNTVRADGCQYFTTVLGPGYNYDHRNHFHFDIKNRRNGYVACR
jgi:hypothetical protein